METNNSTLPIGTILHSPKYSYKIVKVLGQGSFGITYLAKVMMDGSLGSLESNMYVAIKEFFVRDLCYRIKNDVACINRKVFINYMHQFIHEARLISRFNHPNIIKMVEIFEMNNTSYNVMEYFKGTNLEEYLRSNRKIDEERSIHIIKQVCSAVKSLHDNKILHLDIKPSNILINGSGFVKLIDFGLSRQYDDKNLSETCRINLFATPGYAPLEAISSEYASTFQSSIDIYGIGATLYTILTGHRPPEAIKILNEGFPVSELLNNKVSDATVNAISKAMQALSKDRIQTVDDFINLLPNFDGSNTGNKYDFEDDYSEHRSNETATKIVMKNEIINDFMLNCGIKFFVFKNNILNSIIGAGYIVEEHDNNNFTEMISNGCSLKEARSILQNCFTPNYFYSSIEECIEKENIFKGSEILITYRSYNDFLYALRLLKKYSDILCCRRIIRESHVIVYGYDLENRLARDEERIIRINYEDFSSCVYIEGGVYEVLDGNNTDNTQISENISLTSFNSFVYLSSAVVRLWATFTNKIKADIVLLDSTPFDIYLTVLDKDMKYTNGGEISIKANREIPCKTELHEFTINYGDDIVLLLNKHAFPLNISNYFGNIPRLLDVVVQIDNEATISFHLKDKNSSKSKDILLTDLV